MSTEATTTDTVRMCCDCHVRPVKPQRNAKRPFYRCDECHRAFKREEMRRIRAKQKEQVQDRPDIQMKRCTKCQKLKHYSAFSYSERNLEKKLNKVCDACLTKIYMSNKKHVDDMVPEWWRARAYNTNNIARNRLARKEGKLPQDVTFDDLEWKCGPNDLVNMFIAQEEKCAYCGVQLTKKNLQVEHKTALAEGGTHSLDNLCLSCDDCNSLKRKRDSDTFKKFVVEYAKRIIARYEG